MKKKITIIIQNSKNLRYCRLKFSKVERMQRPGTGAIRTQTQPAKPKREITKITNSQNTKRTYGQPNEQLFLKRWPPSLKQYEHKYGETSPKL